MGLISGGLLSYAVLLFTHTKSNVSYFLTLNLFLRASIWLLILISTTKVSFNPLHIYSSDAIYFAVTAIFLFDSLIMQFFNLLFGKFSEKAVIRQHEDFNLKVKDGYKVYNDISIISVVFPIYKWIFG